MKRLGEWLKRLLTQGHEAHATGLLAGLIAFSAIKEARGLIQDELRQVNWFSVLTAVVVAGATTQMWNKPTQGDLPRTTDPQTAADPPTTHDQERTADPPKTTGPPIMQEPKTTEPVGTIATVPNHCTPFYDKACMCCKRGDAANTVKWLKLALSACRNADEKLSLLLSALNDPDLDPIRDQIGSLI